MDPIPAAAELDQGDNTPTPPIKNLNKITLHRPISKLVARVKIRFINNCRNKSYYNIYKLIKIQFS